MSRTSRFAVAFAAVVLASVSSFAQTASDVKPSVVAGDVISIVENSIMLKTANGELAVTIASATEFKRVPADNPKLSAAVPASRADIGQGDKLAVSGFYSQDRTSLAARTIFLMSKSDIAQKQKKEAERWSTRGISGKVTAVDRQAGKITIEVRGLMGSTNVALTPKESAVFKRYAPNSVKYSESIPSSIANINEGDMLRAVGDRSQDGQSFAAEEILAGAFETIAGTVKSVDVVKNEVIITDLQTNKDVIVELRTASLMKRFPEEWAQRFAAFQGGGQPNGTGQRPAGGQPGTAGQQSGQPGAGQRPGGMGGMGGPRGGIDEMLERFPNLAAGDLKAGDMIAVSSTKDHAPDRVSAIKVLAGVEPFIRAAQAAGMMQRAGGGRGGLGSFSIPGLDGVDFQ